MTRYKLGAAAMAVVNPGGVIKVKGGKLARIAAKLKGKDVYRYIRIYRPGNGTVSLGEVQVLYGGKPRTR